MTRRKLASALLTSTAAAALPQTQTISAAPEDELKAARDRLRATAETLSRQAVPMATEPAFQFKV